MKTAQVLLLMFACAVFSGCTNGPTTPSDPVPSDETEDEARPTLTVDLEDCTLSLLRAFIPREWGDPFLAPGFSHGFPGIDVYQLDIWLRDCERAAFDRTVETDVRWLDAGIVVDQDFDNESSPAGLLVVVSFVSHASLAQALQAIGIESHVSDIVPMDSGLIADVSRLGWTVAGPGFEYSYEFLETDERSVEQSGETEQWYPGPPHTRRDVVVRADMQHALENDVVTMSFDGQTDLDQLVGRNQLWTFEHWLYLDAHEHYEFLGGFEP